jgi:hypothetical protein
MQGIFHTVNLYYSRLLQRWMELKNKRVALEHSLIFAELSPELHKYLPCSGSPMDIRMLQDAPPSTAVAVEAAWDPLPGGFVVSSPGPSSIPFGASGSWASGSTL